MQINALVLEGSQQALNREVIDPTALAVHADHNLCVRQQVDPIAAGELADLICIEYLRCAVLGWATFSASMHNSASTLPDSRRARTLRPY